MFLEILSWIFVSTFNFCTERSEGKIESGNIRRSHVPWYLLVYSWTKILRPTVAWLQMCNSGFKCTYTGCNTRGKHHVRKARADPKTGNNDALLACLHCGTRESDILNTGWSFLYLRSDILYIPGVYFVNISKYQYNGLDKRSILKYWVNVVPTFLVAIHNQVSCNIWWVHGFKNSLFGRNQNLREVERPYHRFFRFERVTG